MSTTKYQLQSPNTMRRKLLTSLVLLIGFCSSAAAEDQDLGALLTARYRDRILVLRHAFTARSQEYDSQGNSLTGGSEGPWTVFGRMEVTKVSVAADQMRLEGDQVVFASNKKGDSLEPRRQRERVKIAIRLDRAPASEDEAVAILSRVFALTPQDVVDSAPAIWQSYLAKQLKVQPSANPPAQEAADAEKPSDDRKSEIAADDAGHRKIFKLGKGIVPPKPISTPEPEFTDLARKQRFTGTLALDVVVDSSGKVAKIAVLRPLGMGLDEAAAATVRTWSFTPGMYDGRPVAVGFYVEVSFNLYDRR